VFEPKSSAPPFVVLPPFGRGLILKTIADLWNRISIIVEFIRATWYLRNCDEVGSVPRLQGRMRVQNRGSIRIGHKLKINSKWIPAEMLTGSHGRITIGDAVWINFGVLISAQDSVKIGNRVMIGQHCIISDSDLPDMPAPEERQHPCPIEIGDGVWLAGRVTIRPGAKIGEDAVVIAGSIVETNIPQGVIAGGIPAKPLLKRKAG
jgi:acetyltransferase-like isoleucine patch superfamily enzyme